MGGGRGEVSQAKRGGDGSDGDRGNDEVDEGGGAEAALQHAGARARHPRWCRRDALRTCDPIQENLK